jgi:3-oxo-5-alpha-steroid 4-dehydrogenase 1
MNETTLFNRLLIGWLALAGVTFVALLFVTAPYGRHIRRGWGATVDHRLGWMIMEAPSALAFAACFATGTYTNTATAWVFLGLWEAHYIHRAFIYPWSLRSSDKQIPIVVAFFALAFNTTNAWFNGRYLFTLSGGYPLEWMSDPRFIAGLAVFVAGYAINRQADHTLRSLRQPGESSYKTPYGGLYRWVSCPNYLGEIIEWIGWAMMTWSLPGLAFALWTVANLAPRARANHRWYQEYLSGYPLERKALVPGLW